MNVEPDRTVHIEDMTPEQVAGFLEWVESEQDDDGFVIEADGDVFRVSVDRLREDTGGGGR